MNHQMGIPNVRRFAAIAFALVMALALTATLATGQAEAGKKKKKAKPVSVSLVNVATANQQQLIDQNKLVVKVKSTGSGTARIGLTGTYTAADGSSGTVRTSSSTSQTKDGYTDSYRRLLVGTYDGHAQRLTFVFRIVVGAEGDDVKVMQTDSSCG